MFAAPVVRLLLPIVQKFHGRVLKLKKQNDFRWGKELYFLAALFNDAVVLLRTKKFSCAVNLGQTLVLLRYHRDHFPLSQM